MDNVNGISYAFSSNFPYFHLSFPRLPALDMLKSRIDFVVQGSPRCEIRLLFHLHEGMDATHGLFQGFQ